MGGEERRELFGFGRCGSSQFNSDRGFGLLDNYARMTGGDYLVCETEVLVATLAHVRSALGHAAITL